jgi:hypothetical protein
MTAKEQVLKVYPDAWYYVSFGRYWIMLGNVSIIPYCDTEEQAWQSAAKQTKQSES